MFVDAVDTIRPRAMSYRDIGGGSIYTCNHSGYYYIHIHTMTSNVVIV